MKIKAIFVITAIFLFFLIVLFVFNMNNRNTFPAAKVIQTDIESAVQQCENMKDSLQDECYHLVATKGLSSTNLNESIFLCEKIGDASFKQDCYNGIYEYARLKADTDIITIESICTKINQREPCENYLTFTILPQIITDNPENALDFCRKIIFNQNFCFEQVSQSLAKEDIAKAIEACQSITAENDRLNCYNQILLDVPERINEYPDESISVCQTFSLNVDSCFERIAYALRDSQPVKAVSVCKLIKDSFKEEGCYDTIWLNVPSYVQSDPELSIEICSRYKSSNAGCYQSIARSLSETSKSWARRVCEEIEDEGGRNWCLEMYG